MATNPLAADHWVPAACTLPTVEQPLRRREFDDLFAHDVRSVVRESPQSVRLVLRPDPAAVARAAALAVKETGCCSFFTFTLTITDGAADLGVSTAPAHQDVLAALSARAEAQTGDGI